ncbi:MAG TPA: lytic transglycosylase domain-containing protein [Candidatus Cloacimonadota bacterium]|nr:lytic transglycosylase domain-containing protein [Candidatus Cloacimonadota bacterium]HOD53668.1 lytic transglycosylase domain-containing protein [Candidatus Cloacimonadota bacterium]HPM01690.1 lytic transglycosylase domain-containing protein [Candidatus Cloacimonadota bacterium]
MKKILILFQFILLFVIVVLFNPLSNRVITYYYSKKLNLNSTYFYRQINSESSFRCFAYSYASAIGPGQITFDTARYLHKDIKKWQLWLPWINIRTSGEYMIYLLKKYKQNYSLALAAYNWGETNVDKKLKYHQINVVRHINYRFLFKNVTETNTFLLKIME